MEIASTGIRMKVKVVFDEVEFAGTGTEMPVFVTMIARDSSSPTTFLAVHQYLTSGVYWLSIIM